MKGLLTWLLLGAAAFYGYRHYASLPPGFGVSASRPMGEYEEIVDYMKELGIQVRPASRADSEPIFGDRFASRSDLEFERYMSGSDSLLIIRSQGGQMLAVGAAFQSGNADYLLAGSAIQRAASLYWTAVVGDRPAWRDGEGERTCSVQRGRAQCFWTKDVSLGPAAANDSLGFELGKAMLRERAVLGDE